MEAIISQMDWVAVFEIAAGILVAGGVVLAVYAVIAIIALSMN